MAHKQKNNGRSLYLYDYAWDGERAAIGDNIKYLAKASISIFKLTAGTF